MSRPELQLSELQLALLRVVWERGEARVAEVHTALSATRRMAATTVATLLARLEKRGLLTHRVEGRQFVYSALVSEAEVSRAMVAALTEQLFRGDVSQLMAHLLCERDVAPGDLARIRRLLDPARDATERDQPQPKGADSAGNGG